MFNRCNEIMEISFPQEIQVNLQAKLQNVKNSHCVVRLFSKSTKQEVLLTHLALELSLFFSEILTV